VIYLLLDLKRRNLGVRQLVSIIESSLIRLLQRYDVKAQARKDAPGVYVQGAKIAALGLRVRRGCSFHGLSLNVDLDLEPFGRINPCGYQGMAVTRLSDLLGKAPGVEQIAQPLLEELQAELGYNQLFFTDQPVGC
jgi:lipoyl(octanoyl) transferase